ncbi:hypothetical protein BC936DRAFT_145067 [Jimgerdemannia flammicorona]|uniref:Uncharacterized protein n=1 Tax=Jimgerdemannia flammicorona TaxID=994334 RepID=A0A433DB03_9FUNG|nr:hypothetical protein BC936DRAFT_145067 [Jimgerdemannia flammicorona]
MNIPDTKVDADHPDEYIPDTKVDADHPDEYIPDTKVNADQPDKYIPATRMDANHPDTCYLDQRRYFLRSVGFIRGLLDIQNKIL